MTWQLHDAFGQFMSSYADISGLLLRMHVSPRECLHRAEFESQVVQAGNATFGTTLTVGQPEGSCRVELEHMQGTGTDTRGLERSVSVLMHALPCPVGMYWSAQQHGCVQCLAGEYSTRPNSTRCFPCPPGTQQPAARHREAQCTSLTDTGFTCGPGRYVIFLDREFGTKYSCEGCTRGTFKSGDNAARGCTPHTVHNCPAGYWLADYGITSGPQKCLACASGKLANANATPAPS